MLTVFRRPEVSIVALAIAVRVIPVLLVPRFHTPLTFEYEGIANGILGGDGFRFSHLGLEYSSMRPVFVYLCALVYWLTGHSHVAMLIVQAVISGATAGVTYTLGLHLGGPRVAALAGLLTAVEPALVYYDVTRIHPVGLHALLLSVVVLVFLLAARSPSARVLLATGLAVGLAFLERGTPAVFAAMGFGLLAYWHRWSLARTWRAGLLVGVGTIAVVAPWTIRNYVVYGRPVLAMTAGPELLWIGNNPHATGTTTTEAGQTMFDAAPADFRAQVLAADEMAQQQLFSEQFRAFVFENPGRVLVLYLKKLRMFWWFGPQEGREHPRWASLMYRPIYAVWLFSAVCGFVVGLRSPRARNFVLFAAFLAAVSMTQSVAFVEGRHRTAVVPVLLVVSAYALVDLASRRRPSTVPAGELTRDSRTTP